jgi:hypothetical protein
MRNKTAALIAVPGVAAVIFGGGLTAAATQQPDPIGSHQETAHVQVWQHGGSGQRSGTQVRTTRATATSPMTDDSAGIATPTTRNTTGVPVLVTRHATDTHHAAVTHRATVGAQGTARPASWRGDRNHDGNEDGDHHSDGDCH